jgi:hypothetical protein
LSYISRKIWIYQMVIRRRKSRKDRQYNDQNKKDKKTNNDLQNTAQNTRDYETRTSHTKPGVNSVALEG